MTGESWPAAVPGFRPLALRLETERLLLGPWTGVDAEDVRALHAERGEGEITAERARAIIAAEAARHARTGISLLTVRRRDEGDYIGYCGLIAGRVSLEEPEIAYELFRRVHGRGYATEAARAVLDAAIATGRTRLWSTVRTWNTPSFRVLEKLGFERDHVTADERGELVWLTRALP